MFRSQKALRLDQFDSSYDREGFQQRQPTNAPPLRNWESHQVVAIAVQRREQLVRTNMMQHFSPHEMQDAFASDFKTGRATLVEKQ